MPGSTAGGIGMLKRQRSGRALTSLADGLLPGLEGLDAHPPSVRVLGISRHVYDGEACCGMLSVGSWPRAACIRLVERVWFEPMVIVVIFVNCVTMASDSPLDSPEAWKASLIHALENASLGFFTIEACVKVLAYGVHFYIHDGFCQLDLATVLLGWAVFVVPNLGSFTTIRAMRGLRPLRALQRVPGMPALVRAILLSLPRVYNVLGLVAFFLLLSACIGVELFQGKLHYRCAAGVEDLGYVCNPALALNASSGGDSAVDDGDDASAGYDGRCPRGSSCTFFASNPDEGLTSFDAVGISLLSLLRVLTMDDWSHIMYWLMAVTTPLASLFFVLIVCFGAFFVVNLFLAVVFEEFIWTQSVEVKPSIVERRNLVEQVLKQVEFYQRMSPVERRKLADALVEEVYGEGEVIVREGEHADAMFIIRQGHARVTRRPPRTELLKAEDDASPETVLAHLHAGSFFGEAALVDANCRRKSTIVATSNLMLLRLNRDLCIELLSGKTRAFIAEEMDRRQRHNELVERVLGKLEFYQALDVAERQMLWSTVIEERQPAGAEIVREGEVADSMYLIAEGSVAATSRAQVVAGGRELAELDAGDFFGESAILEAADRVRKATVTATEACVLLRLDRERCFALLGSPDDQKSAHAVVARTGRRRSIAQAEVELAPGPAPPPKPALDPPNVVRHVSIRSISLDGGTSSDRAALIASSAPPRVKMDACEWLRAVVSSSCFGGMANALVVLNIVLMCFPYYGMPHERAVQLELAITAITGVFVVEMFLKLLAYGCGGYWADRWNRLDGSIVLLSVVEMGALFMPAAVIVETMPAAGENISADEVQGLSFLRIVRLQRLLRLLRLLRTFKGLHRIVSTFGRALNQMLNLLTLLLLFLVVASLIGMQIFGGAFRPETGYSLAPCPAGECADASLQPKPRLHFDFFWPAMLTVFTLLTGEWADAMRAGVAVFGPSASLFYVASLLVGRFVIMNLLIAVVLNAFSLDIEEQQEQLELEIEVQEARKDDDRRSFKRRQSRGLSMTWPRDYSFGLFVQDGYVRTACQDIVAHGMFDVVVTLVVIASCIALALDTPRLHLTPEAPLARLLLTLDVGVWPWLFLGELIIKSIATGFVCAEHAYLSSWWNRLDFLVVVTSFLVLWAHYVVHTSPDLINVLDHVRVVRALRPLQLVQYNPGMRACVSSLLKALPKVSEVLVVVVALQAIFAIVGMQIFMGALASCSDPALTTREACVGGGHTWANQRTPPSSFDSFWEAMLTLYVMMTGDDWQLVMFATMDATTPGHGPVRDDLSLSAIFSLCWMFLGYFVASNLIVGVIVDQFNRIRLASGESATLTPAQQQWIGVMRFARDERLIRQASIPPSHRCLTWLRDAVQSQAADTCVFILVVVSMLVMSSYYHGIENDPMIYFYYTTALNVVSYALYVECFLKLVALGRGYFADPWNVFDFAVVVASIFDQLAQLLFPHPGAMPLLLRVFRLQRGLRVLKLLRRAQELKNLLATLVLSLPTLLNVFSLIALLNFIYALIGVELFSFAAHGEHIDAQRNFESFGSSMLLIFECLTNDGWSGAMIDLVLDDESGACRAAGHGQRCGSWFATPFFISLQILGPFVFLNLVVAVILEHFSSLGGQGTSTTRVPGLVTAHDIERFHDVWALFDVYGNLSISRVQLPKLVLAISPPLGLKGVGGSQAALGLCMRLNLLTHDTPRGAEIHFTEILQALVVQNFKANGHDVQLAHEMARKYTEPSMNGGARQAQPPMLTVSKTQRWTSLRDLQSIHKEEKCKEEHDAGFLARQFALEVIAGHLKAVVQDKVDAMRKSRVYRAGRRPHGAEHLRYVGTEAPSVSEKAEALATAIYDNLLQGDALSPTNLKVLPTPSRLPPPRLPPGSAGASPERQMGTPPLVQLPPLTPPRSDERSNSQGQSWKKVHARAYDQYLNPNGWPEPAAVKEAAMLNLDRRRSQQVPEGKLCLA